VAWYLQHSRRSSSCLRQSCQGHPRSSCTNQFPRADSSPQSCTVRAATLRVSARWSTSSLSLRPFLAPCACSVFALLQFSSELHCQSYNAQSPPLPSKTLRGTPSLLTVTVCDHFVRDSARVPLPFSTDCCHARMFHECMPNVLTRCFTT